jgi:DNA-binding IclR family transcriptional regulator
MKKRAPPSYFVPALEKGLDILEALAEASTPQTLAELARTLKRTSSELFRMIDALEKRSYIARDPATGAYRLTLKLYELAHTHSPVDQLLRAAELPMRSLAASIHESCHLSVMSEDRLLVVAQAESPEPVRLSVEVGSKVLPLQTVSGTLLTAFMPPEVQKHFLQRDVTYAALSARKQKLLRQQLATIRSQGWHLAPSTRRTGLDLSCIVGNPQLGVSAALGVPFLAGFATEGKERQTLPEIQACAQQITQALGLSPGMDVSIAS